MSRRAVLGLLVAAALAIGAAQLAYGFLGHRQPAKPPLLLLTSLPLLFGENFSLDDAGSEAATALSSRYRLIPISLTDPAELAKAKLLLMAQPQAQPPENLVALDDWVRGGGRLLLLADPMLEWPSERPLGDRLRPPPMFMDTGLLAHWGLRLDAGEQGAVERKLGGLTVKTVSPGKLSGACAIPADRLVARCRIGKGRVTVVADADLLDVDRIEGSGSNLEAVLAELEALGQP